MTNIDPMQSLENLEYKNNKQINGLTQLNILLVLVLNLFDNFCEKSEQVFLRRFIIFGPSIALVLFYLTRKLSTPVKGNIPRGLTSNGGSFELQVKNVGLNN